MVISLQLVGADGSLHETKAAINTGFTDYAALPSTLISSLHLDYHSTTWFTLSDGSNVPLKVYEAVVRWENAERDILVMEAEGTPLVGMALLRGNLFTMEVVDGGRVTIEALT